MSHADRLDELKVEVQNNEETRGIVERIESGELGEPWCLREGLLMFKGKLCVPSESPLAVTIAEETHSSAHEGRDKTLKRIKAVYHWQGMRKLVEKVVRECQICQKAKEDGQNSVGHLQPLPIPEQIWEDLSMDFVEGLPNSGGKNAILVVVDRLSKFSHFIPIAHPYTAPTIAQVFFDQIFRLYGMPKTITCDRDPLFTSIFWKELFKLQNTKLNFSSSYHPQTDGQTERVNRVLEMYVRCCIEEKPKDWVRWIPWVQYAYNTSWHRALQHTPYEVVFGRSPPSLLSYVKGTTVVEAVDLMLEERQEMMGVIKSNLSAAQDRMKEDYDKGRREVEFEAGERVLVKLPRANPGGAGPSKHQKLKLRFSGPYKILKRVGKVAYELELPSTIRVHPVFHLSKLKKYHGQPGEESETDSEDFHDAEQGWGEEAQPQVVMDRRRRGREVEFLVHWRGKSPAEATWVNEQDFKLRYPGFWQF